MKLYHSTTETGARAILAKGFRDGEGRYMADQLYRGVWLTDSLDESLCHQRRGTVLLSVEMDARMIRKYEWVEEGKGYREWLVPAELVNRHATIRRVERF